jgi:hypothetical protein
MREFAHDPPTFAEAARDRLALMAHMLLYGPRRLRTGADMEHTDGNEELATFEEVRTEVRREARQRGGCAIRRWWFSTRGSGSHSASGDSPRPVIAQGGCAQGQGSSFEEHERLGCCRHRARVRRQADALRRDCRAHAGQETLEDGRQDPAATINAAIIREIRTKGKQSRFRKTGRGLFAANKSAR